MPSLFAAGPVAGLLLSLTEGAGVPSGMPWLDRETNLGPRDVEVNRLAIRKVDAMLPDGCGKSDALEALDDELLESALGRLRLTGDALEPRLEHGNAVLASAAVSLQVVGGITRRDQSEIPCVFGGTGEPVRVQCSGESEEHPERRGDDQPVGSSVAIQFVEP